MIHPDPQDVRDAIKEIERLLAEVEHYKTLYYKHTMEDTRES
jgi:hypothetical protein